MRTRRSFEDRTEASAKRKVRVVHVVPRTFGRRFGGHTHYVFSLLSGWKDEDVTLDLWGSSVRPTNIGSGNTAYEVPAQLWSPGRGRQRRVGRLTDYLRQLAFLVLNARRYDIAHFHHLGWATLLSPPLLHLLGRKVVYTMTLFGSDNPSAVRKSRGGRLAAGFMRRFDGIVALSPLLVKDSVELGLRNVICLPNFLALPHLERGPDAVAKERERKELSIPLSATVLLFVGAVIRRKGVDLLAESFVRLAAKHPDLWLIIVGPKGKADVPEMNDELVHVVRERMDRAGVSARVVWAGMLRDRDEVAARYAAADIFVFPTRAEGMPNVLCEAMTAGLPVVATNLQGITDFAVADGETGLLFPPEDVDAMTQAVDRLVTDQALRASMGKAARLQSKRFGFEEYRHHLRAFYLKVAGFSLGQAQTASCPTTPQCVPKVRV